MTEGKGSVPASIQCRLCGEVCRRGVSLSCCQTISCRSCATKSITSTRTCWSCGLPTNTSDLVNNEQLRQNVERFNKGEWDTGGVAEEERKEEKVTEDVRGEEEIKNSEEEGLGPAAKKMRCSGGESGISLTIMQERNTEFDKFLLPKERSCLQLRVGAQLELIFEFSKTGATCMLCDLELSEELMIRDHLVYSHPTEFGNLKTVLRDEEEKTMEWVSQAIKSEFLYLSEKIFPVEVM